MIYPLYPNGFELVTALPPTDAGNRPANMTLDNAMKFYHRTYKATASVFIEFEDFNGGPTESNTSAFDCFRRDAMAVTIPQTRPDKLITMTTRYQDGEDCPDLFGEKIAVVTPGLGTLTFQLIAKYDGLLWHTETMAQPYIELTVNVTSTLGMVAELIVGSGIGTYGPFAQINGDAINCYATVSMGGNTASQVNMSATITTNDNFIWP